MGAWHLRNFLEKVQPTAVLVEGPSDATENLVHLAHKDTKPPIAILAFTKQRPVRSILFPLAAYSPEWVALTWALKNKRVAKFMDLPAATFLALERKQEQEDAQAEKTENESDSEAEEEVLEKTDTQAYLNDPYEAIAQLSGDPDHDTWWEKTFEHSTIEDSYRLAVHEFGKGLREIEYEGARGKEETLLRESYMRRVIRETIAEGHDPEKIVIMCGAFHSTALVAEIPAMSDEEYKKMPRVDTVLTLMPYSYVRLSSQSGYGAGNKAPMYFQALWEEAQAGSTKRLPPRFLSEIAAGLRKRGTVRSSAEVIEAVRLAETVAALAGDAPAPTLRDLRDSAVTLLGQGDPALVDKIIGDVTIGHAIGKVPKGVMQTALQDDFRRWAKDLKLDDYLVDKEQIVKGSTSKDWLDLRRDRFAKNPDAEFRDLQRSIYFHRLDLLGIGFASNKTTDRDREESTYKEVWAARWTPDCEINLAENSLRGDTIELAAANVLNEKILESEDVSKASELVIRAIDSSLTDSVVAARRKAQELATDDGNFPAITKAGNMLGSKVCWVDDERVKALIKAGEDKPIKQLVAQLFLRGVLIANSAARCGDDAREQVGRGFEDLRDITQFSDRIDNIDEERFRRILDQVADDDLAHPYVQGVVCALLLERGEISDDVLDRRVAKRISPGNHPDNAAQFFEGLATRNRYALLSRKKLWGNMSTFIESLDDDEFRHALAALRRAFGSFEQGEARKIADILAELWGGGGKEIHEAIETKLSTEEIAQAQAQEAQDLADQIGDIDLDI